MGRMTKEEASIIIGNIPIDGKDDCYTVAEYQGAKAMAIEALLQQPEQLPPAQPEVDCQKCVFCGFAGFKQFQTAQPETIHCEDCE